MTNECYATLYMSLITPPSGQAQTVVTGKVRFHVIKKSKAEFLRCTSDEA